MAVKIRLARRGRKKRAIYDVVVADVRAPRDGRFIEKLGSFNPTTDPATINIDVDQAFKWVMDGAEPTDTARQLLSQKGVMFKKHLQVGVNKGAITQETADEKFEAWLNEKESALQGNVDTIAQAKDADTKSRLAAEAKVSAARAEQIAKKQQVVEEAEVAAKSSEEAPATEEVKEEVPAAEAKAEEVKEEAPVVEAKVEEVKKEAPAAKEVKAEEVKEEAPVVEAKTEKPAAAKAPAKKADDAKGEEKAAE